MDDSFGPGGFDVSHSQASGVPSEKKAEGILPVLIGQLLKEQAGSELTLFGMNFAMVSTVAIVRNIDHSSTKITYLLEDHTGQIEAHYWLEEGDMTSNPKVLMNTYAKVYGSVRNSAGTRAIMIFAINSCNINQLTTHLLEVLSARYMAEEFSKNADKPSDAAANGDNRMTGFNAPFNSNGNNSSSAAAAGLTGKQLMVFNAIKTHKSESGISLSELQKNYSHISPGEMSTITDFLSAEGHIYSSIDCEHFLATDPE